MEVNMSAMTHQGDLKGQINQLKKYLEYDPSNSRLLCDIIDLHLETGDLNEAKSVAEQALSRLPNDPALRFRLATVHMHQQSFADAEEILINLINEGTSEVAPVYNLAYIYSISKRFQVAKEFIESKSDLLSGHTEADKLLIYCLHQLGNLDEARELAQTVIKSGQVDPDILGLLALVEFDRGDHIASASLARNALDQDPENRAAMVSLGMISLDKGDSGYAGELFKRAIAVSADDGRSWLGLALAHLQKGRHEEAKTNLTKALELIPSHPGTWIALGWCEIFHGNLGHAERAFDTALFLDRNFAEAYGGLSVVHTLREDAKTAEKFLALALRLDKTCISARYSEALLNGTIHDIASNRKFTEIVLGHLSKRGRIERINKDEGD